MHPIDEWQDAYPSSWKGVIVPEAMSHPAKYSSKLIRRIYEHMIAEGWVVPGDCVLDPFGGVALGAWDATRLGLHWTGLELELKFFRLGSGMDCPGFDKAYWKRYHTRGRKWNELNICPDCGNLLDGNGITTEFFGTHQRLIPAKNTHRYHGNIETWEIKHPHVIGTARLLHGDSRYLLSVIGESAQGIVSSPPYADISQSGGTEWLKREGKGLTRGESFFVEYGESDGQLSNMPADKFAAALCSPPYAEARIGQESGQEQCGHGDQYGGTDGQLGSMPADGFDAAVSSPPFMDNNVNIGDVGNTPAMRQQIGDSHKRDNSYGITEGQLGNEDAADFWLAARAIVEQVYQALAPGGHAVWVVKDYVKNKQIVPFSDQWRQLCEAVGFQTVHEHHAMLVHHKGTQHLLEGGTVEKKTESKSFFRRLAEKKGSPRIDFETVFCMVKK